MIKRRIILSVLSALLVFIVLIGSTGFTVVIQSCRSCGISVNTSLFASVQEDKCCGIRDISCTPSASQTIENVCCTFSTEKLRLTNFLPVEPVISSLVADVQPVYYFSAVPKLQEKHIFPQYLHNKHGSRDVLISNCQFLI